MNINKSLQSAAEWLLNSQTITKDSADKGRYVYAYNLKTKQMDLSSGWQTAFSIISLLGMNKLTGDSKYIDSANLALEWLKSLQIMDVRKPAWTGAIKESTPLSNWSHPRDALSVAWAFLIYYQFSDDQDCLERAEMFANWYINYAFSGDWPIATCNLGKSPCMTDDLLGSFQSGGILFLLEMYKYTQNINYYNRALKMSEFYVKHFINEKGVITCLVDLIGNNEHINNKERWPEDWQKMHQVNDDFGGIALIESYNFFKKEIYKERAIAYFEWLEQVISPDGSFFNPVVEVGSATCVIFLQSLKTIVNSSYHERIEKMINKCLNYLLSIQVALEDKSISGAFLGMDNNCRNGNREWINIRVTNYTMLAMLKHVDIDIFPRCAKL